jgi:hypothetical protein
MGLRMVLFALVLLIAFATLVHAVYIWRHGNRFGSAGLAILALSDLALMYWVWFIREVYF